EQETTTYKVGEMKGPNRLDLQPASVGVKNAAVTVRKIKLFRDSYHSLEPGRADVPGMEPGHWADPSQWNALRDPGRKMLYVQPGHYLCLGDNSLASSDGRSWGLVPQRLMLGRALLVYYPFSRAGRIR